VIQIYRSKSKTKSFRSQKEIQTYCSRRCKKKIILVSKGLSDRVGMLIFKKIKLECFQENANLKILYCERIKELDVRLGELATYREGLVLKVIEFQLKNYIFINNFPKENKVKTHT